MVSRLPVLLCILACLFFGCRTSDPDMSSGLASDSLTEPSNFKVTLSPEKQEILKQLGQEIILHLEKFRETESMQPEQLARCRGCSLAERRNRFQSLLSKARSPRLNQLIAQTLDQVLPDVLDQVFKQASASEAKIDEKRIIEIFNQIDSLRGLAASLGFRPGAPGNWTEYFATVNALRQNASEELLKDDVNKVDWDLVRSSASVLTKIFVLSPYDLTPIPLTMLTTTPRNDATYRALFFSRGADLWISSVLVQHILGMEEPIQATDFDNFELPQIPKGLPAAVYDDEANYSANDYQTLKTIGTVMSQLALEEDRARVIKGLNMIALGIRYGSFGK